MEQKHNKQLHTEEYSIEYSAHEQQPILEVIFEICSSNIPGTFCTLDPALRPGSNVQNISGIFQKLLHKSAAAHGQNIQWNILPVCRCLLCFYFISLWNIPGIFCRLDRTLRPGSNVQIIPGIFQKLLLKSAVAHGQNIQWDIPLCAAVYVFIPFCYGIF